MTKLVMQLNIGEGGVISLWGMGCWIYWKTYSRWLGISAIQEWWPGA